MKILFTILAVTFFTTALSQITTETTSSTEHSTTLAPVTTTTEISTTTTSTAVPPTTTTEKSTTTSSTTASSTTEEPVTTPAPITPTPVPEPEKCSWNVTEGDVTCIRAEMKAQFIIDSEGKKSYINLGCNATLLNIDCSSNVTQTLELSEENKYKLTMVFEKESDKFSVKNITFDYVLPDGEKGFESNDKEKVFNVKIGNSYLCKSESNIHLGNVTMEVSDMHIQAFGTKDKFGAAEQCDADDKVSGIIPIAVGIALAALIIIVLIAYLVGRRRSRQRGYQSV